MDALLSGHSKICQWVDKLLIMIVKRAKKDARKIRGKPPKLTAWQIIKLLA